jgi:hypothetical protein
VLHTTELDFHVARDLVVHALVDAHALAQRGSYEDARARLLSAVADVRRTFPELGEGRVGEGGAAAYDDDGDELGGADPFVVRARALLRDVEGQALLAVGRGDYFNKWGTHYLPSLAAAHALQTCNNFKDPGVQGYGGALFAQLRDEADEAFKTLPPPPVVRHAPPPVAPPGVAPGGSGGGYGAAAMSAADLMARYMDPNGGCFDADARVAVPGGDDATRRAGDVRRGDLVLTPAGPATVQMVLHTYLRPGVDLVRIAGAEGRSSLTLTPYHPVRVGGGGGGGRGEGGWAFPTSLPPSLATRLTVPGPEPFLVVDFVLDVGHAVVVNGVPCITLAHGVEEDADGVAAHPFFGTQACVHALGRLKGAADGLVVIGPKGGVMREAVSGLIVDYAQVE